MGFMDDVKRESEQYGGSVGNSDFFKFEKAGLYRVRILVKPRVLATHFFGKGVPAVVCVGKEKGCLFHKEGDKAPSIKLVTYVIDRQTDNNKIKLAELPLSISYSINDLQNDPDFAFEDFPMAYDVKIMYDPDNNDPKAKYRLQPSPKQEPLTEDEALRLEEAMKKITPEQFVEKRKEKQLTKGAPATTAAPDAIDYPAEDIDPNDISF